MKISVDDENHCFSEPTHEVVIAGFGSDSDAHSFSFAILNGYSLQCFDAEDNFLSLQLYF